MQSWTIRRACRTSQRIDRIEEPMVSAQVIVPSKIHVADHRAGEKAARRAGELRVLALTG